jgi:hypothetical protein
MLCLLRVELELSIQAKAVLIARDADVTMPPHRTREARWRKYDIHARRSAALDCSRCS